MKLVAALGGNALLQRGQAPDLALQQANADNAARALAALSTDGHALVVTHGNGPQVGLLALQSAALVDGDGGNRGGGGGGGRGDPLDLLDAETEGMIGYLIEQALRAHLPQREIVALLTQVEVDPADPGFAVPSKPIGPLYDEATARHLGHSQGWSMVADGTHWRRCVASPQPLRIVELGAIRLLLESGAIVICAGGGGIPVRRTATGILRGIEAVIDKDLCSALLATDLQAEALLLLTDVDAVYLDWGTPRSRPVHTITSSALRTLQFAPGSMGPKVEAACRFVEAGGGVAGIGRMEDALRILKGDTGTLIRRG